MVAQIMPGIYVFAPDAAPEAEPEATAPAIMLADIDNLAPADVLAELPY